MNNPSGSTDVQRVSSGTAWESLAGYSRAVRIGNVVAVSGTTASDEHGNTLYPADAYAQTKHILAKIGAALEQAGGKLSDVMRTRVYVLNFGEWEDVARAHGEVFKDIRPANTLVIVRSLVPDDALVEIEADAIIAQSG
jgi:enamine deaminase RidA (YjgF/YER057c/UK114 family)